MSDNPADDRMAQFEADCAAAGTNPEAVLKDAGLHRSAWFRWRAGKFSPTLRSWDAVQAALARAAGQVQQDHDEAAA